MRLIRNDAPVDELAACARAIPEDKSRQGLHDRTRSDVMRIANLTDAPILRVPAQPWTTVTSDDDFVSHLISIFFTWHIESYPCVDKDVFIQAMTSGDTNSLFCSPFLVNCLLLTACVSPKLSHRSSSTGGTLKSTSRTCNIVQTSQATTCPASSNQHKDKHE